MKMESNISQIIITLNNQDHHNQKPISNLMFKSHQNPNSFEVQFEMDNQGFHEFVEEVMNISNQKEQSNQSNINLQSSFQDNHFQDSFLKFPGNSYLTQQNSYKLQKQNGTSSKHISSQEDDNNSLFEENDLFIHDTYDDLIDNLLQDFELSINEASKNPGRKLSSQKKYSGQVFTGFGRWLNRYQTPKNLKKSLGEFLQNYVNTRNKGSQYLCKKPSDKDKIFKKAPDHLRPFLESMWGKFFDEGGWLKWLEDIYRSRLYENKVWILVNIKRIQRKFTFPKIRGDFRNVQGSEDQLKLFFQKAAEFLKKKTNFNQQNTFDQTCVK